MDFFEQLKDFLEEHKKLMLALAVWQLLEEVC